MGQSFNLSHWEHSFSLCRRTELSLIPQQQQWLSEPLGEKGGPGFWKEGVVEPRAKLLVLGSPWNLSQG